MRHKSYFNGADHAPIRLYGNSLREQRLCFKKYLVRELFDSNDIHQLIQTDEEVEEIIAGLSDNQVLLLLGSNIRTLGGDLVAEVIFTIQGWKYLKGPGNLHPKVLGIALWDDTEPLLIS